MSFYDEIANDLWEIPTDENGEPEEGYDYVERGDDAVDPDDPDGDGIPADAFRPEEDKA